MCLTLVGQLLSSAQGIRCKETVQNPQLNPDLVEA